MLVTHPAFIDYKLTQMSSLVFPRLRDFELVTNQMIFQALKTRDVELISFSQV